MTKTKNKKKQKNKNKNVLLEKLACIACIHKSDEGEGEGEEGRGGNACNQWLECQVTANGWKDTIRIKAKIQFFRDSFNPSARGCKGVVLSQIHSS